MNFLCFLLRPWTLVVFPLFLCFSVTQISTCFSKMHPCSTLNATNRKCFFPHFFIAYTTNINLPSSELVSVIFSLIAIYKSIYFSSKAESNKNTTNILSNLQWLAILKSLFDNSNHNTRTPAKYFAFYSTAMQCFLSIFFKSVI